MMEAVAFNYDTTFWIGMIGVFMIFNLVGSIGVDEAKRHILPYKPMFKKINKENTDQVLCFTPHTDDNGAIEVSRVHEFSSNFIIYSCTYESLL